MTIPRKEPMVDASFTAEEWTAGLVEAQTRMMAVILARLDRMGDLSIDQSTDYLASLARDTPYPAAAVIFDGISRQLAKAYRNEDVPDVKN